MRKQKQYFINGLILVIIALFSITIAPYLADSFKMVVEKHSFAEFEFFTLTAASLFYIFSPKYYKFQIISVLCAFIYYFAFLKIYKILL